MYFFLVLNENSVPTGIFSFFIPNCLCLLFDRSLTAFFNFPCVFKLEKSAQLPFAVRCCLQDRGHLPTIGYLCPQLLSQPGKYFQTRQFPALFNFPCVFKLQKPSQLSYAIRYFLQGRFHLATIGYLCPQSLSVW